MRIIYIWFAAALFMVLAMARGMAGETATTAEAKILSTVPYTLSQIQDETLKSALTMYKPDYDTLPRQEQVGSFVNLYTTLHSVPPELSAADAALNAAHAAALSAPVPFVPRYEPWHDPTWYPGKDEFGLDGWRSPLFFF